MHGIALSGKSVWVSLLLAAGLALAAFPVHAVAVVYRVTIISQVANPYLYSGAWKLNNRGEVVFSREKLGDLADQAIFLYSGGRVSRLSPTDKSSQRPDLNDLGEVTWQNWYYDPGDFNPKYEKCLYSSGQTTLIEKGMYASLAPLVNNRSQVLYPTDGNGLLRTRFWLFDHGAKTPITDGEHIDDNYALNNPGAVAWVRTTLEPDAIYLNGAVIAPGASDTGYYILKINDLGQVLYMKTVNYIDNLWLYNGQQHVLIRGDTQAGVDVWDDLNNQTQVAYTVREDNRYQVYLYDQGHSINITPPGSLEAKFAKVNNRGQVVMTAITPAGGGLYHDQLWLYEAGRFFQVTYGEENYIGVPQFNDRGQIAWQSAQAMFLASPVCLPPFSLLLD